MSAKIKSSLIAFFLLGVLSVTQAQDRYEFAIISYSPNYQNISISVNGAKYTIVEVTDNSLLKDRNFNPVLIQVNKFQDQGWELFNTAATGMAIDLKHDINFPNYLFYMRRKVKQ